MAGGRGTLGDSAVIFGVVVINGQEDYVGHGEQLPARLLVQDLHTGAWVGVMSCSMVSAGSDVIDLLG